MDVPYLIMLLQNKLNYLSNARSSAAAVGDLAGVTTIDNDILTTQNTIAQLNLLTQFNQAAQNQNTTPAAVIANVLQNMPTQGPSASAIINGYDISAYATDPLYEQKIQNILSAMPAFTSGVDLTTYIQTLDPGSPVDGGMIVSAAQQYNVDIPLMTAIMQNDSQFGTLGVGAVTNNPGNVGNTGYATHTYASWQEGVNAVAEWLSNHRVSPLVTPPPTLPDPTTPTQPTDQTSTTTSTSTRLRRHPRHRRIPSQRRRRRRPHRLRSPLRLRLRRHRLRARLRRRRRPHRLRSRHRLPLRPHRFCIARRLHRKRRPRHTPRRRRRKRRRLGTARP